MGYTAIRGVFDFSPALFKKKRRSVYGVKRPTGHTTYISKKNRKLLAPPKEEKKVEEEVVVERKGDEPPLPHVIRCRTSRET